ncbi:MAG: hypothetical protein ACRESR_07855 [Gammaproteobacteria bacterium]
MIKPFIVLIIVGAALALTACATRPTGKASQQTAANQQTRTVCVSGTPTGSHVPQTHCVVMTATRYNAYEKAKEKQAETNRAALHRFETKQDRNLQCNKPNEPQC